MGCRAAMEGLFGEKVGGPDTGRCRALRALRFVVIGGLYSPQRMSAEPLGTGNPVAKLDVAGDARIWGPLTVGDATASGATGVATRSYCAP
jgi:hypothetical protein